MRQTDPSFEQMWLPLWPLASDELLEGIYRQSRTSALRRRYIEANPQALSNLIVVDIDHPDAALRALSAHGSHPMPNVVVSNPANGHAHAVWALTEPVTRTEYARRKPLAYMAACAEGVRRAVDGDRSYSGLMTKNPTHVSWETEWLHTEHYSMPQLEDALGANMPARTWRRARSHRDNPTALGRNCLVFDSVRTWAYRPALMRQYLPTRDSAGLHHAIAAEVAGLNATITATPVCPGPLPASEVRAIAASIHRWITRHSRIWNDGITVYEANLIARQSVLGRKGGETRRERSARLEALL